jgi:dihydropteroate synthase
MHNRGKTSEAVHTLVMGILNVTPDSFSDGGRHTDLDRAVHHAHALVRAGADIIDVGGEATSPGVKRIPDEIEHQRVLPVVRQLARDGIRVSIDTMNASTAEAAIDAGAEIVNDVSGGLADPKMSGVVAQSDAMYVATHWRAHSATAQQYAHYDNTVDDVAIELQKRIDVLTAAGVRRDRLIIDPGFGFSKNAENNWEILAGLDRLNKYGLPVLVGVSRKRFLADVVPPDAPIEARDIPTAVISSLIAKKVWAVRVHDVAGSVAALRVIDALNTSHAHVQTTLHPTTLDRITLTGLRGYGFHGVLAAERATGQDFLVDVTVWLDLHAAASGDDLSSTIHYGVLAQEVVAAIERDPVDLIETVAERIAQLVLAYDAAVRVRVTVHKPHAPITVPFSDVSVTIERNRR